MLRMHNKLTQTAPNSNYNDRTPSQPTTNQQNAVAMHNKLQPTLPNINYNNQTPS